MAQSKWVTYGLFFLGMFLIVGGIAAEVGALKYEVTHVSSTENPSDFSRPHYEYADLPANQQRTVDGAIDGKRYVLDHRGPVPGMETSGVSAQEVMVNKRGTYHILAHRIIFDASGPFGMAAIGLVLGGFVAFFDAIRRHHFPNKRLPWQAG